MNDFELKIQYIKIRLHEIDAIVHRHSIYTACNIWSPLNALFLAIRKTGGATNILDDFQWDNVNNYSAFLFSLQY